MGYKELKEDFDQMVWRATFTEEVEFRKWLLRLLFEINGNLDSLVVSYRELVKLQKERMK